VASKSENPFPHLKSIGKYKADDSTSSNDDSQFIVFFHILGAVSKISMESYEKQQIYVKDVANY
jgi:hypothetical protein